MGALIGAIVSGIEWLAGAIATGAAAVASAALALATTVWNGLKAAGQLLSLFGRQAWGFLRDTWDKVLRPAFEKIATGTIRAFKDLWSRVLKPAWTKFNRWVDRAHEWLKTKFGPILCWLQKARKYLTLFYDRVLKPILEIIDVAHAVLKILSQLGIDWARKLDAKLAALEHWITGKLGEMFARIGTVEGWINRIVTLDGLFQKVIHVRSLVRDVREVSRAFINWRHVPPNPGTADDIRALSGERTTRDVANDIHEALLTGGGRNAALRAEVAATFANALR